MAELKPCPFCGNEHPTLIYQRSLALYKIHCPMCDIYFRLGAGGKENIEERIVEAWNRRRENE